jgi:hypothetical protein
VQNAVTVTAEAANRIIPHGILAGYLAAISPSASQRISCDGSASAGWCSSFEPDAEAIVAARKQSEGPNLSVYSRPALFHHNTGVNA